MDKKDRNTKPGDSEIVTRKGFLMTPPKKADKKPSETTDFKKATEIKNPSENKNNNEQKRNEGGKNKHHQRPKHFSHDKKPKEQEQHDTTPVIEKEKTEKKDLHHNDKVKGKFKNRPKPEKKQPQEQQKNEQPKFQKANRSEESKQDKNKNKGKEGKKNKEQLRSDPAILSDLGFMSDSFSKRKKTLVDDKTEEKIEKIDYSKAIPLRDQIYPPKKEKAIITEEEKEGKIEIIGVRFKEAGKIYYFDPSGTEISFGTPVIVETARGLEYGFTAISNRYIPCESIVSPLKKIVRIATKEDKERLDANKALETQAATVFEEKVAKLGLEMSLVGVEYTFDNTKLLFYFAAENRIDFRELVKELAAVFRTRIELRQVGVRDEAKMLGGIGVCGRPLCCKTFLGEFAQVSIKMAKDQSLSLSSSKISGTCGRLLCCLRYEDEVYQQEYERTPKVDAIVETDEGKGVVVETNPLKGIVRVRLDSKKDSPPQAFHRDTVKIIGYLRNTNNAVDAELKELEKE